jgi:type II secretory pathway pseudopilin PulG
MHSHFAHRRLVAASRGGFTLVEMLVATTLVLMMMLMFAQIYVTAIGSLGDQQAIARNDAKTRLVDTLIRGDLQRGSFRSEPGSQNGIVPLVRDDDVKQWQKGYFYLSENDENDPLDDNLQLTTYIIRGARNRDPSYYYGKCEAVPGLVYSPAPTPPNQYNNHPDIDDAIEDGVGASRAAEVCYFVRNGNLYRRSLLIRDMDLAGNITFNSAQPSRGTTGTEYGGQINPASDAAPTYYKAFDYVAYCKSNPADPTDTTRDAVQFLGLDALENRIDSFDSLGRSHTRFGFFHDAGNQYYQFDPMIATTDPEYNGQQAFNAIVRTRGRPVDYDAAGNYFGRPTHRETGDFNWKWPGTRFNPVGAAFAYNSQTNTVSLAGTNFIDTDSSSREAEDLLLTNVEAFDIAVWDPGLHEDFDGNGSFNGSETDLNGNGYPDQAAGWVQLGNTSHSTGYFRAGMRLNPAYGPGEDANGNNALDGGEDRNGNGVLDHSAVFDTGHPDMWSEDPFQRNYSAAALTNLLHPPYRPLRYRFTEDLNGNGAFDASTEDVNNDGLWSTPPRFPTRSMHFWEPNTQYQSGQVVMRPGDTTQSIAYRCVASGEDIDGDRYLDPAEDINNNNTIDPGEDLNLNNSLDASEDTNSNTTLDWGTSDATAPIFPTTPGARVNDGTTGVIWEAFENRVGLQKIQITIRFRDSIDGLPRQISIVHSFINPEN